MFGLANEFAARGPRRCANGPAKGKKAIGRPLNTDSALAERVRQMRAEGIGLLKIGRTLGIGTGLAQRMAYTPVCPRTEDLQAQALARSTGGVFTPLGREGDHR